MSVTRMLALLAGLSCACGPDSGNSSPTDTNWLVGVYSGQLPTHHDVQDSSVDRYIFEEGGMGVQQRISFERVVDEQRLTWTIQSSDEAQAHPSPHNEAEDRWFKIGRGADCNTLVLTRIQPLGYEGEPSSLHRGEVCARQPDPETPTYYQRYWCDEPPPPCEDP